MDVGVSRSQGCERATAKGKTVCCGHMDVKEGPPDGCWCAPRQAEGDVRSQGWLGATAFSSTVISESPSWMKVCLGYMDVKERPPKRYLKPSHYAA